MMLLPPAGDDPRMPPVIVPIVQAKLLVAVAVSATVNAPQVAIPAVGLSAGFGLTVTVISEGDAGLQVPPVDVGITE